MVPTMASLDSILKFLSLFALIICVSSYAKSDKTAEYSINHQLTGKASWYGDKFHGKPTASGEIYSTKKLTAAHKTLPFGTIVRVTNTVNHKSVDVKINDRGPFAKGKVIDLSRSAFSKIGDTKQGILPVRIEILDDSNTFQYK